MDEIVLHEKMEEARLEFLRRSFKAQYNPSWQYRADKAYEKYLKLREQHQKSLEEPEVE